MSTVWLGNEIANTDGSRRTFEAIEQPSALVFAPTANSGGSSVVSPVASVVGQTGVVTGSQIAADPALSATYVSYSSQIPEVSGRANGLLYNGSDESATVQSIINSMSTFGGGSLVLEGVARCDSQITFPQSGSTGSMARMAPIRITSRATQFGPGEVFSEQTPKPMPGLDLRYAGRTDTGCSTTVGSTFITNTHAVSGDYGNMVSGPGIPDWTWIIGSIPGSGWVVTQMARATAGSVSLTSFGGRLQALNIGSLEIDRIQFTSGGTSSAPFGISTGPNVNIHDCVFEGMATKSGNTCDEDPWIYGGPGQGTYLTAALVSGNSYNSVTVAPTPVAINPNSVIVINTGGGTTQQITTGGASTPAGSVTINTQTFTANANYGINTGVLIGQATDQGTLASWNVPAAPFQGYMSRFRDNQLYRVRSVRAGMFASDLNAYDNSWMHNCGSNWSQTPSKLTSPLTGGTPVTSIPVAALPIAYLTNDTIQIGIGSTAIQATVAAPGAAAGALSVPVNSVTPATTLATNTVVFNVSAGLSAPIISHADAVGQVNTFHCRENRLEIIAYNYMTIFKGFTQGSVLAWNNVQDVQASTVVIGGHRFETNASYNTVIPGLMAGLNSVLVDDRSSNGTLTQTSVSSGQSVVSAFPQGLTAGANVLPGGTGVPASFPYGVQTTGLRSVDPITTTWSWTDPTNSTTFMSIGGTFRTLTHNGAIQVSGNSAGAGSTYLTLGNNSTASDAQLLLNPPTGNNAQIQFKYAGSNKFRFYTGSVSNSIFLRDDVNGNMAMTWVPGATAGAAQVQTFGSLRAGDYLQPSGSSGPRTWGGSGAPTTPGGAITYNLGDRYERTDTPGTANQRLYVVTTAGASPTWTGIL